MNLSKLSKYFHHFYSFVYQRANMKRLVLDRFNINTEFKPVNNELINFYLDKIEKRIESNHRTPLKYYTIIVLYVVMIVKNSICLFSDLDFNTRLKVFDLSYLIGGIPKYNQIIMTLPFVFGLTVSYKIHISRDSSIKDFLLLLNLLRGKMKVIRLFLDRDDGIILKQMTRCAQLVYSIMNMAIISLCKYIYSFKCKNL